MKPSQEKDYLALFPSNGSTHWVSGTLASGEGALRGAPPCDASAEGKMKPCKDKTGRVFTVPSRLPTCKVCNDAWRKHATVRPTPVPSGGLLSRVLGALDSVGAIVDHKINTWVEPTDDPEPWQLTRAEFHKGKLLHGSGKNPTVSTPRPGFYTTEREDYALFYANSDMVNAVSDRGDIWAADAPARTLDLTSGLADAQLILNLLKKEATRWIDAYLDGKCPKPSFSLERALSKAQEYIDLNMDVRKVDSGLRNVALEIGSMAGRGIDISALYHVIKAAGYTAFVTWEELPRRNGLAKVTVFVERPMLISHREQVRKALSLGKPVPPGVLADYPFLMEAEITPSVVKG